MSTTLERVILLPDDSSEERRESQSSRRREYYSTQRGSRPSTSASHGTSKSQGKRVTYDEPDDYKNLDETAAPPPVQNRNDDPYYRRQPSMEQNLQAAHDSSRPSAEVARPRKSRESSARRRRNVPFDENELTEVEAPPPVQYDVDQQQPQAVQQRRHLEDEERRQRDADEEEDEDSPSSHQQRRPEDYQSKDPDEVPKWLTEIYTISYLVFFALMGTLARLGTQWITFYPGTPIVTPVIWANFGGSLIMGFLSEDQGLFRPDNGIDDSEENEKKSSKIASDMRAMTKAEATKRKKAIPFYIGLATGFCGSYTSFSSFVRDYFLALANNLPTPIDHPHPGLIQSPNSTVSRNGGYGFQAFLHVVIATIALSLGGLILGAQIAIFLDPITPRIHGQWFRKAIDPAFVVLGFGCWLGAVFLAIWPPREMWRGEVIFALVTAPPGCLLRFYASAKLNGLVPAFPLGTFAVNMFGTAVEGMCYDLQHVALGALGGVGGGIVGCQVLQGVMDGFCGCLTTVSTWVAELNGLQRKHGWAYAFASIMGGLGLMLVIMGSVRWSIGFQYPVCDTGYTSKVHG